MNDTQWQVGITLDQMEKKIIKAAMQFWQDNQTATAEALGISVKTLYNKLKQYKEEDDSKTNGLQSNDGVPEEREMSLLFGQEVQEVSHDNNAKNYSKGAGHKTHASGIASTRGSHARTNG